MDEREEEYLKAYGQYHAHNFYEGSSLTPLYCRPRAMVPTAAMATPDDVSKGGCEV